MFRRPTIASCFMLQQFHVSCLMLQRFMRLECLQIISGLSEQRSSSIINDDGNKRTLITKPQSWKMRNCFSQFSSEEKKWVKGNQTFLRTPNFWLTKYNSKFNLLKNKCCFNKDRQIQINVRAFMKREDSCYQQKLARNVLNISWKMTSSRHISSLKFILRLNRAPWDLSRQ